MVGTLVRGCRCATSWCDLDLTFDLAVVTLMLCVEAMDALAPRARDLKPEYLPSPLHLMCVFKKLNLS